MRRIWDGISSWRRGATAALFCFCILAPASGADGAPESCSQPSAPPRIRAEVVERLIEMKRYLEAEPVAVERLAQVEACHGPESLEAAEAIDLLVYIRPRRPAKEDGETAPLAARAIRIKEALLGPDHPGLATTLYNQSQFMRVQGNGAGAVAAMRRSLEIREKALGPEHPDTLRSYIWIAKIDAGEDLAKARADLEHALVLQERNLGPLDPEITWLLGMIAGVVHDEGDYVASKAILDRALSIFVVQAYPEPAYRNNTYLALADIANHLGDVAAERDYRRRAVESFRAAFGSEHPALARFMIMYAGALARNGEWAEARAIIDRALPIVEGFPGPSNRALGGALLTSSRVLMEMGDCPEAIELLDRAIEIFQAPSGGPAGGSVPFAYLNKGEALLKCGDPLAARPFVDRGLELAEELAGSNQDVLIDFLIARSRVLRLLGEFHDAHHALERARAIQQATPNLEGPVSIQIDAELGDLLTESGEPAKGRLLLEDAFRRQVELLGADHPAVGHTARSLALAQWGAGSPAEAFESALLAETIGRESFRLMARALPQGQALRFARERPSAIDILLSMVVDRTEGVVSPARRAFEAVARSRAIVLDEMARRHRAVASVKDETTMRLMEELASARSRLARLILNGTDAENPARYPEMLALARRRLDEAERALAARGGVDPSAPGPASAGFEEIRRSLPAGSALVAWTRYERIARPAATGQGAATARPPARYIAFIARADAGDPVVVPLAEATLIEEQVARWRNEASVAPPLVLPDPVGIRGEAIRLREMIWDPLDEHLRDAFTVFVVADGALSLVSVVALPLGDRTYLLETGPLVEYLSAERDLLEHHEPSRSPGGRLLAVGGAAFDEAGLFAAAEAHPAVAANEGSPSLDPLPAAASHPAEGASPPGTRPAPAPFRGMRSSCADFATTKFAPLPATAREAAEVAARWEASGSAEVLTGAAASEAAFKARAPGARVIHLATHGFFLGDNCPSVTRREPQGHSMDSKGSARLSSAPGDNPLVLSGLVLAGANHRALARGDEEDGILTAEEIASLDLSGTELATLSGCDTGGGALQLGEGVIGLRRAFQIAGAESLVMSLWAVEDESALRWSRAFYEARIAGASTPDAARRASLRLLEERRRAGLSDHPFYWAAFVAAGN